ncbi:alanyl-tRNA editing protein [Microbacterium aureliae]
MTAAIAETHVDYPSGAVEATATILRVEPAASGLQAVVLDRTAFHPVDARWPDQPADRGNLRLADGTIVRIQDAVIGGTDGGPLLLGAAVPVRTGTEGWTFVVAHLVAGDAPLTVGDLVTVTADRAYRDGLSRGHTACHLASLALDRALAEAWSKEVPRDALGAPGFDALACESSRILPDASVDTYRVGKSLRRKGFDAAAFDDPAALAARVNDVLAGWVSSGAAVHVDAPGDTLTARREWVCDLPEGAARIPCGGTHATSLGELGRLEAGFTVTDLPGAREVVMRTSVIRE